MSASESELIDIPMNDWSTERLQAGEKTATTRTRKYGEPGDRFEAAGKLFEVTHVVKVPLETVARDFYDIEGAADPGKFVGVWEDIHHRKGFVADWMVWLHLFREVER